MPYAYGGSKYARNPPVPPEVRGSAATARALAKCVLLCAALPASDAADGRCVAQIHVVLNYGREMDH